MPEPVTPISPTPALSTCGEYSPTSGRTTVYEPALSDIVVQSDRGLPPIFANATVVPDTPAPVAKSRIRPDTTIGPRGIACPSGVGTAGASEHASTAVRVRTH